jgi:hypothetical protein
MEIEMNTNIKNLPTDQTYFTEIGYSDSHVWVEIARSATGKTVHLARVEVDADPEWTAKMKAHVGGFCAHVSNQNEQTWLFARIVPGWITKIRQTKKGWSHQGVRFVEGRAHRIHDYNF